MPRTRAASNRNQVSAPFSEVSLAELVRLNELNASLLVEDTLEALLETVLKATTALLGADMADVQLYHEAEHCLRLAAHVGLNEEAQALFQEVHEGLFPSGLAMERGENIEVEDALEGPATSHARDIAEKAGFQGVNSTILRTSKGKLLGILTAYFQQPKKATEVQKRLLGLYAQQAERVIERKQAEEILRASERKHKQVSRLLELSHDGIIVRDLDDRIQCWNQGAHEMYGWSAAEAFGQNPHRLLQTQFPIPLEEVQARLLSCGRWQGELNHRTRDGNWIVVDSRWALEREDGQPSAVLEINREITARKKAEEALRQKEEQLRLVTDNAPVMLAQCDREFRFVFVNNAYASRFGMRPEEFPGKLVADMLGENSFDRILPYVQRAFQGETFEYEIEVPYRQIGLRTMRVGYAPSRDRNGAIDGWVCAATDITERRQAEMQLHEAQARLQFMADNAPVMIWVTNADGKGQFFNRLTCEFTGMTHEELKTVEPAKLIHAEDLEEFMTGFTMALNHHRKLEAQYRVRRADGAWRWVKAIAAPRIGKNGKFEGLVGSSIDITDVKAVEQALAESEQRFRTSVEGLVDGFCIYQAVRNAAGQIVDFRIQYVNEAACRKNRLSRLEQVGRSLLELMPEHSSSGLLDSYRRVVETGAPLSIDGLLVEGKAGKRWLDIRANKLNDGVAVSWRDVTWRRDAEAALRESEHSFRQLADSMPQMVWTSKADGSVDYLNRRWSEVAGINAGENPDQDWIQALHPDDRERCLKAWSESVRTGRPYEIEYRLRYFFDGDYRWHLGRALPVYDAAGRVSRWFGTCTDIHDQKQVQEELRENRERLQAALVASGTGTFRWNILTNELDWDEPLDRLFGLPPGKTARSLSQFIELVHPEDRAAVLAACGRCAADSADFDMEFRVVWPDGSIHWLDDKGKTYLDELGRPSYMTGACVDITARKASRPSPA